MAILESYRASCRFFLVKRYPSYRVLVFPNFAAISHPEYCIEWVLSEEEPLEDIVRRFQSGGLHSTMITPPKVVKLGTSQVRQPPRMQIQAQDVEDVIKVLAIEKQKDELITEDKKAEQKNDEKKSPARKKVKMKKEGNGRREMTYLTS